MVNNKKCISPVVAVALLLVVTVVAVVGFQSWFNTYSSGIFINTEIQSNGAIGNTQIDTLIGNSLYFKNGKDENITITSVKINGVDCNITRSAKVGITELDVSLCLENITTSVPEVVIYTDSGIYSEKVFLKEILIGGGGSQVQSLNCSALGLNGGEWITVPGNIDLGTSDFCVMKYEAKDVGGIATSQPALFPWININQTESRIKCQDLGVGYDLVTNAEWMSIARVIENDTTNWADGSIGSTIISGGGLYRGNNQVIDSVGCGNSGFALDGNTDGTNCSVGSRNKRTYNLSGELIWDISGNVWEFTNDTVDCNLGYPCIDMPYGIIPNTGYIEQTELSSYGKFSYNLIRSINNFWNTSYGIGSIHTNINSAWPSGNIHAVIRGGYYGSYEYAGLFAMTMNYGPSVSTFIGFRCTYTP